MFILASLSWYLLSRSSALLVRVEEPVYDVDQTGVGSVLRITLGNVGRTTVEPSFWVLWLPYSRVWDISVGPSFLDPGETAEYTIRVGNMYMGIPDGAVYLVKVFDRRSGLYFRSESSRLDLEGTPPIRNPGLRFWSAHAQSGAFQPFGWQLASHADAGDAVSANPADGVKGLRLNLQEDGTGGRPTLVQARQVLDAVDVLRLRNMNLTLCWEVAISFRDDREGILAASGLELAVEGRLAWMVFSPLTQGVVDLQDHRIFIVRASPDRPGCSRVPLGPMLDFVGEPPSGPMIFSLFGVAWPSFPGSMEFVVTSLLLE